MAGIDKNQSPYHALTAGKIIQSERNAQNVSDVIRNQYINPFMVGINSKLVNISSGVPVNNEAAKSILSSHTKGSELYDTFKNSRLKSTLQNFHSTITKKIDTLDLAKSYNKSQQKTKLQQRQQSIGTYLVSFMPFQ